MITPVSFNGVELNPADGFFKSDLLDAFNANKDLTLSDLLGDGQAWGSSKVSPRNLVLNITAGAHDLQKLISLNKMVRGNQLKPLIIDTDIGKLIGYAEVTNFAWSDDSPLIISAQLTMPDPYWYALEPQSIQLGSTYSTGVVFGPGHGVVFAAPKTVSGKSVDLSDALKVRSVVVGGHTAQDGSGVKFIEKWEGALAGNRNLLPSSATMPTLCGLTSNGSVNATSQGDGFYRLPLSNILEILQGNIITTIKGNQYTESFYYKTDSTTLSSYFTFYENNNVKHNSVKATIQNLGNGIYRAYATAMVEDTAIRAIDIVLYDSNGNPTFTNGTYIDIGKPKFEHSATVTDYSPAPEDLLSYLKFAPPKELLDGDSYDFIAGHGMTAAKQPITGTPNFIPSRSTVSVDNGATVTAVIEPEHGDAGQGITFGSATGESGTLTNSGNADAYPVITVVGTCSGIGIRNQTTGEHIDISTALGDSDTLVIDCRPATCGVYLNGVPHIEYKTSPGWIHCPPGDNQFSFSRSSLQNKKHCTVELQSRWI